MAKRDLQETSARMARAIANAPEHLEKRRSLRDVVREHRDGLLELRERGFTYDEIVDLLQSEDVEIASGTLRQYLVDDDSKAQNAPKRRAVKRPKRTRKKSPGSENAPTRAEVTRAQQAGAQPTAQRQPHSGFDEDV